MPSFIGFTNRYDAKAHVQAAFLEPDDPVVVWLKNPKSKLYRAKVAKMIVSTPQEAIVCLVKDSSFVCVPKSDICLAPVEYSPYSTSTHVIHTPRSGGGIWRGREESNVHIHNDARRRDNLSSLKDEWCFQCQTGNYLHQVNCKFWERVCVECNTANNQHQDSCTKYYKPLGQCVYCGFVGGHTDTCSVIVDSLKCVSCKYPLHGNNQHFPTLHAPSCAIWKWRGSYAAGFWVKR